MPRPRLIRETLLLDDEVHGDLQGFGRRAVVGAEADLRVRVGPGGDLHAVRHLPERHHGLVGRGLELEGGVVELPVAVDDLRGVDREASARRKSEMVETDRLLRPRLTQFKKAVPSAH